MKMICVDDERLLMEEVVEMCESLPEVDEATGFTGAAAATNWMNQSHADIALLDIDMAGMNGIELAIKLKELNPDIAIIFLTGYAEYAVDVIASHIEATGYLLKPVNKKSQLK